MRVVVVSCLRSFSLSFPCRAASSSKRQTTISDFKTPDAKSMERFNMAVAYFIVTCCLPLSLVDKLGFILLCAVLRPGFKPAGRKALVNNYIPKLLHTTKQTLKALLKEAAWIACTSDAWTSKAQDSYISLTAHFINSKWELMCFTLCCRYFFFSNLRFCHILFKID